MRREVRIPSNCADSAGVRAGAKKLRVKSSGAKLRLILAIAAPALILGAMVAAQTGPDTTADAVLGQPDFSHNSPNTVDASSLAQPGRVAVDTSASPNRLYVADTTNNRILGWRSIGALVNHQVCRSGDRAARLLHRQGRPLL
jgi:hypothetical protein